MANSYALDLVCGAQWVLEGADNVRVTGIKGIRAVEVTDGQLDFLPDEDVTFLELGQLVFCEQAAGATALLGSIVQVGTSLRVRVVPTAGAVPIAGKVAVFPVLSGANFVGTVVAAPVALAAGPVQGRSLSGGGFTAPTRSFGPATDEALREEES